MGSTKTCRPRVGAVLTGLLLVAITGCTAATRSPALSERPTAAASESVVAPTSLPSSAPSSVPTDVPTAAASPSDYPYPDENPGPPPALAKLTTVDVSGFQSDAANNDPYWVTVGSGSAALHYDTSKAKGSIPVPLTKDELNDPLTGGYPDLSWNDQFVVITTEYDIDLEAGAAGGCGYVAAIAWQILVAVIDSSGKPSAPTVFAVGQSNLKVVGPSNTGAEGDDCAYPRLPTVAMSDGLIAYNIEKPSVGQPFGSEILVRSLADGSTVRDLTVPDYVDSLQLSGPNLVWMEFDGNVATSLPLRISTAASPGAQNFLVYKTPGESDHWTAPKYWLSGNLLAWDGFSTGKVWLRDLATGKLAQISPTGAICELEGFDGTDALMTCGGDPKVLAWADDFSPDWVVLWSSSAGDRLLVSTPPVNCWTTCAMANGSVLVDVTDEYGRDTYWTIPVAALTGS